MKVVKFLPMRRKVSQVKSDEDRYGYRTLENSKKRLNLNDLLRRAKDEEKNDKKFNLLIYSCAAFVIVVFSFIVSL